MTSQVLPEVNDEGVLIKMLYAGIRTCDVSASQMTNPYSLIDTDEVYGKVISVGCKVPVEHGVRVGDVIVVYPLAGCGKCENCMSGNAQLCEERATSGSHPTTDHHDQPTTSSQFLQVADWHDVVKIPREMTGAVYCMLPGCALRAYSALLAARSCFEHAVRLRGFANLLLCGSQNSVGSWCIVLLKYVFADRNVKVLCADCRRDRLDLTTALGADDAVLWPPESTTDELISTTTMSGYNRMDVIIDTIGSEQSFAVSLGSLHSGGTLFVLGHQASRVDVPLSDLVSRSVTVRGVAAGSREQLVELIDLVAVQRLDVNVPVECYRANELTADVLDRLKRGDVKGRAIIMH